MNISGRMATMIVRDCGKQVKALSELQWFFLYATHCTSKRHRNAVGFERAEDQYRESIKKFKDLGGKIL